MERNRQKKKILLITIIVLVLITVVAFSYAYVLKNTHISTGNINQTISFEGEYNLTTYGETNTVVNMTNIDMFGVNYDKTLFDSNSNITIELYNEYQGAGTTCSYNYVWVWDENSDDYVLSKEAEKEFTVSSTFGETQVPNYNENAILGTGKIATTTSTLKTIDFTTRFYNLENIDQSAHMNKTYKGSIRIGGIRCSEFRVDSVQLTLDANTCATKSQDGNTYTFGTSCTNPNNYAFVDNSDLCEEDTLYRIISVNIQTGVTELVKSSDIEVQTWDYWVNNNFNGKNKITLNDEHFIASGEGTIEDPFYLNKNISVLYSLNIATDNTFRTRYDFEEVLDTTGLTVNAVYTDGSVKVLSKSTDPTLGYTVSEQKSTIDGYGYELTYIEEGITKKTVVIVEIGKDINTSGQEIEFIAPLAGYYKLETWGAQGGTATGTGGYGGYSEGYVYLNANERIFINVGGAGGNNSGTSAGNGGYNGGGKGGTSAYGYVGGGGGGGATHIAKVSGLLSTLSTQLNKILIVASGGGGNGNYDAFFSSHGGGYIGNSGYNYCNTAYHSAGGTQTGGAAFGQGAQAYDKTVSNNCGAEGSGGGGGGYYGGTAATSAGAYTAFSGGGGSGYIGNTLYKTRHMYCYDCNAITTENIKTYTGTCVSTTATPDCAKRGNGYAKITYAGATLPVSISEFNTSGLFDSIGEEEKYKIPVSGYYQLETWGAQGGDSRQIGGYGGYSTGIIYFEKDQIIYVNVGGKGNNRISFSGGKGNYNGGGDGGQGSVSAGSNSANYYYGGGGGGGATHIALQTGLLSSLSQNISSIIMVAGGGGGGTYGSSASGQGGGYAGSTSYNQCNTGYYAAGGTQSTGYLFGQGRNAYNKTTSYNCGAEGSGGGGGGLWGGSASTSSGDYTSYGGGGGSGYIGYTNMFNKYMFCYNCPEDDNVSTYTVRTNGSSSLRDTTNCAAGYSNNPVSKCAKAGEGYAKITLIAAS